MTPAETHAHFELTLARVMRARDPARAIAEAARDPAIPAALRAAFASVDAGGVQQTARRVCDARRRRLLSGCPEATRWSAADPEVFAEAFRRYHEATPARAFFPAEEARDFASWLAQQPAEDAPKCLLTA